jgi:hypothetical protein
MLIKSYDDTIKSMLKVENNMSIVCSAGPTCSCALGEAQSKEIKIEDKALKMIIIFISNVISSEIRTLPNSVVVPVDAGTTLLFKRASTIVSDCTDNHPTVDVIIGNLYFAEGLKATAYIRIVVALATRNNSGNTALK